MAMMVEKGCVKQMVVQLLRSLSVEEMLHQHFHAAVSECREAITELLAAAWREEFST